MFLKNKNIIFKIRRSKVTDYAALTRACNIAIVFLWSKTPITPRCLVSSEVVICNPGQSVVHIQTII